MNENPDKIYMYATDLLLNNTIIIFSDGIRDKEVPLADLIENYKLIKSIRSDFEWFKCTIDGIKIDLDKRSIK